MRRPAAPLADSLRGSVLALALLTPATLWAGGGRAARAAAPALSPVDSACFDHHELAQELRQSGQLLASRSALLACSASECPSAVRSDCERWSTEVARELPSVVFRVTLDGEARQDARVLIDGEPLAAAPEQPHALDPGLHAVRVSLAGATPFESQLRLRAGDAERRIDVALESGRAGTRRVPTLSWIFGGVGVAGAGAFIGFGLSSRSLERELEHSCSPLCSEREIDRVRQRSLIANVSLGIGLTSLATAAALYFLSSPKEPEPERPVLQLGLVPLGAEGVLCNVQLRAF